jgi:hypothetical protein
MFRRLGLIYILGILEIDLIWALCIELTFKWVPIFTFFDSAMYSAFYKVGFFIGLPLIPLIIWANYPYGNIINDNITLFREIKG